MKKSNIERREERVVYGLEQFQKMVLGFMPGGHVIESFLNYRSDLKQKRVLDFSESLKNAFEQELGKDLENYNFENEDFVDLMDSVLTKVQNNRSQFKLDRFKAIIVNSVKERNDLSQVYVNLTESLNEIQVKILDAYEKSEDERKEIIEKIYRFNNARKESIREEERLILKAENGTIAPNESIAAQKAEANRNMAARLRAEKENASKMDYLKTTLNLSNGEYDYYFRDLVSRTLLFEREIDVLDDGTMTPYIEVTEFAKGYLSFIRFED